MKNTTIKIDAGVLLKVKNALKYLKNWQSKDGAAVVVEVAEEALTLLSTAQPQPEVTDDRRKAVEDFDAAMQEEDMSARAEWLDENQEFVRAAISAHSVQEVTVEVTEERFLHLVNSDRTHRGILSNVQEHFLRDIAEYISEKFPNGLRIVRGEGGKL